MIVAYGASSSYLPKMDEIHFAPRSEAMVETLFGGRREDGEHGVSSKKKRNSDPPARPPLASIWLRPLEKKQILSSSESFQELPHI